ncbi:hypothetical protein [Pararobbsia silviterrae]|nr:hypothetical protein [Pararobbsia silviterrae]
MLKSSWCLRRADTTCAHLREHFARFVDGDDGLIVSQVSDWAALQALDTPNALASR